MVIFLPGTKDGFLITMGSPYGYIFAEDCEPLRIFHSEQGQQTIREAFQSGIISGDEAQELERGMVSAKLPKNLTAIVGMAREFVVPKSFIPSLCFRLCSCGAPLPHGAVQNFAGERISEDFHTTIAEALCWCDNAVRDKKAQILDAVRVFKQVIGADLPLDEEDRARRLKDMPAETLRAHAKDIEPIAANLAVALEEFLREK